MKPHHVRMYMEMAEVSAKYSHATRLKVGSIFVRDNRILSIGINGTPPNDDNCCEEIGSDGIQVTKENVIHSEQAGIYKAARDGESLNGASLFVTHSPCFKCSLAIISVGIKEVYFRNQYREAKGIANLIKHGVLVYELTI